MDTSGFPLAMGANWKDLSNPKYREMLRDRASKGGE